MNLSIVTPVRDDPLLPRAIASVPLDVEHVVAMTRPTPPFRQLAESLLADRPKAKLVETEKLGMAAGVNLGVTSAGREKIVMLDSDCTLTRETLRAYDRALERAAFVRGCTEVETGPGWARFSGLGQASLNRTFAEKARLIGPSIAFLKTPFLELGGYDEHSGGSCDHEFVLRMEDRGLPTIYEPEAVIRHRSLTFPIDCRAHLSYGRSMRYIDRKRGGRYGLGICLDRLRPATLWQKLVRRGPSSVWRSMLLGCLMLTGYTRGPSSPAGPVLR